MSGPITAGGLISGIDSDSIIQQLVQVESGPIRRMQAQITKLKSQQESVKTIRTQLQALRGKAQDFRLNLVFNAFNSASSDTTKLTSTVTGSNPVLGSFALNVTTLASATVANSSSRLGAAINPAATLASSGINTSVDSGTFTINGVQITVDSATQSLNDVVSAINGSAAGVTASYNAGTDTVTLQNTAPSNTNVINLGANGDTSNILTALNLKGATQTTNLSGSTELSSTVNLGAVGSTTNLNATNFAAGAVSAGSFSINGVSITVDPTQDTLQDVLDRINSSDANVTANYDSATDRIRLTSNTLGSRTIAFGAVGDTSNFLTITNLSAATQTAGSDATFTVNGGPTQTRNTNEVNDAISGVTLKLLSLGTSTVTVNSNNDKIVDSVKAFIDEFNKSVESIELITGKDSPLAGDGSIRSIESYLRGNIFNDVPNLSGEFKNLLDIGISTGSDFAATETPQLKLDEDKFRKALQKDRLNVERIFANGDTTGAADIVYTFLEEATKSSGFLNERSKSNGTIDLQIKNVNESIARQQDRLGQYEERLRKQFLNLETLSSNFQRQSAALSSARFGSF